jgi:hypothetical protein
MAAFQDFALVEHNLVLKTVGGDIAAQAVEFRMSHGREDLRIRVDGQTLLRHGNLGVGSGAPFVPEKWGQAQHRA